MRSRSLNISVILLLICILSSLTACDRRQYRTDSGMVWNTVYNITYDSSDIFTDSILNIFDNVGKSVSLFDEESVVSKVNNESGPIVVDSTFITIYNTSLKINRLTKGAFDPTLSPLITAWGFGKGHKATPDTARIDSILCFVGLQRTHLSGNKLIKDDARTQFNFSAIAKGFGCDEIGRMFKRNGVNNYLVEIGGEIVVSGQSKRGSKWNISIDRPNPDALHTDSQMIIEVTDCGIATSGNYRNYQTGPQGNYGHTINPKTGRPAETDILSATVVAATCMEADALATSFMVLGKENAVEIVEKNKIAAMFVLADHSVWMSSKFKQLTIK